MNIESKGRATSVRSGVFNNYSKFKFKIHIKTTFFPSQARNVFWVTNNLHGEPLPGRGGGRIHQVGHHPHTLQLVV